MKIVYFTQGTCLPPTVQGYFDRREKEIHIAKDLPKDKHAQVLHHEIGHYIIDKVTFSHRWWTHWLDLIWEIASTLWDKSSIKTKKVSIKWYWRKYAEERQQLNI